MRDHLPFTRLLPLILAVAVCASDAAAQRGRTGGPAQPAPAAAVTPPADYVIGPEDVLGVLFWREQEMSGDFTVRPDGKITLPLLGDLMAAGMTPPALKAEIETAATKYLSDVNVTVVVRQLNSRKVYVTGEVATPGAYALTGPRTVMQIIALAGGLNEYAKPEEITIMRQAASGSRALKFNYKDVAKGKKLEQNVLLQPGDTVIVP